jgi:hypothetical protein
MDDKLVDRWEAVAGVRDQCAVCGKALDHAAAVGVCGVNGVICQGCRANSALLNTAWAWFYGPVSVDLWRFPAHTSSPYWGTEAACLVLEQTPAPTAFDCENATYRGQGVDERIYPELPEQMQEVLCWLACHKVPPDWTIIRHERLDNEYIKVVEPRVEANGLGGGSNDSDLRFEHLERSLPELFVINTGAILAHQRHEDEIVEALSDGSGDPSSLDAFADAGTQSPTESRSRAEDASLSQDTAESSHSDSSSTTQATFDV